MGLYDFSKKLTEDEGSMIKKTVLELNSVQKSNNLIM